MQFNITTQALSGRGLPQSRVNISDMASQRHWWVWAYCVGSDFVGQVIVIFYNCAGVSHEIQYCTAGNHGSVTQNLCHVPKFVPLSEILCSSSYLSVLEDVDPFYKQKGLYIPVNLRCQIGLLIKYLGLCCLRCNRPAVHPALCPSSGITGTLEVAGQRLSCDTDSVWDEIKLISLW